MQRVRDFQRTVELVNKFIVDTMQMMNRFAADCDRKMALVARQLHHVEAQVVLLEYKLNSIEGDAATPKRQKEEVAPEPAPAPPPRHSGGGPPPMPGVPAIAGPPGMPGTLLPPHMQHGAGRPMPPPMPGQNGPPLPPGVTMMQAQPAQGALMLVPGVPGAPPPMPGMGAPPPPPMPVTAGLTVRTHPRLSGYFRMQSAGVPVAAIKAKMQADGYKPEWFDTPDMPSPLPAVKEDPSKTLYDSD